MTVQMAKRIQDEREAMRSEIARKVLRLLVVLTLAFSLIVVLQHPIHMTGEAVTAFNRVALATVVLAAIVLRFYFGRRRSQ